MSAAALDDSERAVMAELARLLGGLLLVELDAQRLEELHDGPAAAALAGLGVRLPPRAASQLELDELAASFHDQLLSPHRGAPPIASLWTEGRYDGATTSAVRALAAELGVEFDAGRAHGAPPDHLGCVLELWAALSEQSPQSARRLAAQHLQWSLTPLARIGSQGGLYGELANATAGLVGALLEDAAAC